MKKSSSTSELHYESRQIDREIKLLHKQIALAEKSFATLIKNFTNISVDIVRLQTRNKELSTSLSAIALEESPTLKDRWESSQFFSTVTIYLYR